MAFTSFVDYDVSISVDPNSSVSRSNSDFCIIFWAWDHL